jgi:hypothetical protein
MRTHHPWTRLSLTSSSETPSESGLAAMMVKILKDNAAPESAAVYDALDMPWAKLVGQIVANYAK